ncbi:MAG: glycosyltransferase family 39 protein [Proteobacteria bacterium]|nr:glycosyltransferase family 39 protein [Pseudomonadota bacterium]
MTILRAFVVLLGVGCALGLLHIASVIGFHISFDPDEGWNAAFTQLVQATGSPYPPAHSLLTNNYPPLSFYVVAAVTRLTGDAIVAGRLVALAALLATSGGIFAAMRIMACSPEASAFAALFFFAAIGLTSDYAGMDDPQMLGHVIAMGGLILILGEPRTPRRAVAAAALFVIAEFVKHNLIALPAATALWLLLADRVLARTFIISGAVFALLGLGLFKETFGFGLLSVISSPRVYSVALIWQGFLAWLPWGGPLLLGAGALYATARHDRYALFALLYAVFSVAAGLYFLGGEGVDANALFDADIALAICAGLLLDVLRSPLARLTAVALYAVTLICGLWNMDANWTDRTFWTDPMHEEREAAAREIAFVHAAPGPAFCETLAFCYWAGKQPEADVFNLAQVFRTGQKSDEALVAAISGKRYGIIEFETPETISLTPQISDALRTHYRLALRGDDGFFFVPR